MMKLTRSICALCLSIQMCLLLSVSGLQMAVVCHSEDGHVAIEAANSDGCTTLPAGPSRESSVASAEERFSSKNTCGACVDVPLSLGVAMVTKKPYRANPASPASTTIAFATVNSFDLSEYQLASHPFTPAPYFSPLRSIILLI